MSSERHHETPWRFLTNHTQVLLCIARTADIRLRDVAEQVGITERAAQRILADLVDAGFIERERRGRRNEYRINPHLHMRHPAQEGQEIRGLLELLGAYDPKAPATDARAEEPVKP
jgi:DNA-binding MarR family transcriptional regulator